MPEQMAEHNEKNKKQNKSEMKRNESKQKIGEKSFSFLGPPQLPERATLAKNQQKGKSIFHSHALSMDKEAQNLKYGKMFPLINTNNFFLEQPLQDFKDQFQRTQIEEIHAKSSIKNGKEFGISLLKNNRYQNQSKNNIKNIEHNGEIKKHKKLDFNQIQTKLIVGSEEISPLRSWTGSRNNSQKINIQTQPNQRSEIESLKAKNSYQQENQNVNERKEQSAINLNISKITGNESAQSSAFINLGGLFNQNKQQLNFLEPQYDQTNEQDYNDSSIKLFDQTQQISLNNNQKNKKKFLIKGSDILTNIRSTKDHKSQLNNELNLPHLQAQKEQSQSLFQEMKQNDNFFRRSRSQGRLLSFQNQGMLPNELQLHPYNRFKKVSEIAVNKTGQLSPSEKSHFNEQQLQLIEEMRNQSNVFLEKANNDYQQQFQEQKKLRLLMQSRVYSQDLNKESDQINQFYSKDKSIKQKKQQKDNVLKKNIKMIQFYQKKENNNNDLNLMASQKFDRLKKLQEKTSQFIKEKQKQETDQYFNKIADKYNKESQKSINKEKEHQNLEENNNQDSRKSSILKNKLNESVQYIIASPMHFDKASESQIEQISVIQPERDHHEQNPQEIIGVSIQGQNANYYQSSQHFNPNIQLQSSRKQSQQLDQTQSESLTKMEQTNNQNEQINEALIQKNISSKIFLPKDGDDQIKSEQKMMKKNIQSTKNLKMRESRKASGARSKDLFTNATETGIDSQNNLSQRSLKQKKNAIRRPFSSGVQQSQLFYRQKSNLNEMKKNKKEQTQFARNLLISETDQILVSPSNQHLQKQIIQNKEKIKNKERGISANTSKINISKRSQNVSQLPVINPIPSASLFSLPKINELRPSSSLKIQKEEEGISILEKAAIYDAKGQLAYIGKHRKPKWVWPEELDRFNRFEDPRFALENKGNNNIRIENPFLRQPNNNKVFDHISAYEVGKYLEGVSYLEKLKMSDQPFFSCQQELLEFQLFKNEIRQSYGIKKGAQTELINNTLIIDFQIELTRDLELEQFSENLKSNKFFLTDFRNDCNHKEFTKCIRRNRLPTQIQEFVLKENQQEKSQQWLVQYDPVDTEKRRQVYGSVVNQSFIKRKEEMERWYLKLEQRSDFDDLKTELGKPVIDQVNKTMSQYHFHKQDKFPSEKYEEKKIEISIEQIYEELDVLQKQSLYINTKFENLQKPNDETIARKIQMRLNVNSFQNKTESQDIQQKIKNEFATFVDSLKKYEVYENSCYQLQSDQSDYQVRKLFEKNTIKSVDWDLSKVINDDIYKQKQMTKTLSRLTLIDLEVINEKGILVPFRSQNPHLEIFHQILKSNFNFQQQNQFYFQWYANMQKFDSQNKKSEFAGFYKIKGVHENMRSRQNEVYYKKLKFLNKNYFDLKHLQNLIYNPQWRNIFNLQEKLIQDQQAFEFKLKKFIQFFPQNQKIQQKKIKKEINQFDKYFYKIDENFGYDEQTGKNNFFQVQRNFNLVFRQRFNFPQDEEKIAVFENYQVIFPVCKDFHDKKYVHDALQSMQNKHLQIIKENVSQVLEKSIQLINKQQINTDQTVQSKKIKRSKSYVQFDEFNEENEIKKIYDQVELQQNFPYTTDIFTPQIENFEIDSKIKQNEVCDSKILSKEEFNVKTIEHYRNKLDNYKDLVNQYAQEIEIMRADNEDCIFLKWIETSLGDQKYENIFLNEDQKLQIPQFERVQLFQNLQSAYDYERFKIQIQASKKSGVNPGFLLTLNKIFQNQIQGSNQLQDNILLQYLPKHLSQQDAPLQIQHLNILKLKDPYILNLSVEIPRFFQKDEANGKESNNQNRMKSQKKGYSEHKFKPKLNHSEQVEEYVQKQLRKEIVEAVEQGDIVLLKNYSEKFGKCLEERPEMHCNYQSQYTGETVLHLALLMNYDTKKSIVQNKNQEEQQAGEKSSHSVQTSRRIGQLVMNPFKKLIDSQVYGKALSRESDNSLQIKESIVEILVKFMNANPNLQNLNGLSPYEIAKSLKQPDKILKIFNEKVQN